MTLYEDNLNLLIKDIKWINGNGKNRAKINGRNIKSIIESFKASDIKLNDRGNPLFEFQGALQCYLLGIYSDCITKSTQSVEMGLIVRLTESLSEQEKSERSRPHGFTFGPLKDLAVEKGIVPRDRADDFQKIIDIRNAHIHGINTVSAMVIANREIFNENKELLEAYQNPRDRTEQLKINGINRILKIYHLRSIDEILGAVDSYSNYQWCANQEFEEDIKRKFNDHMRNFKNKGRLELFLTLIRDKSLLSPDWYHKMVSEETLPLAFELLNLLDLKI